MQVTFCLIHGAWHDGSCWAPLAACLRERGHRTLTPDMPFDDPAEDNKGRAQPAIQALAGVPDPIVVVGHSVGSAEAALVAAERPPALLVYLCPRFGSFPVPPEAPDVFRAGFPFPSRDADGTSRWNPEDALHAMYPRLPLDTARDLATRLRPAAAAAGEYPLSVHPDVPTALVYATDDEFFTPEWQRFVASDLLGIEPVEIPGGHFPMQEDPAALCELLHRLTAELDSNVA
jgi:pimeloyl-ACP methyl ester carboxylesterase